MNIRHLLLSACLLTAGFAPNAAAESVPVQGDLYGEYLAGSYANYIDDAQARAQYFGRAFERISTDKKLGRLALVSALNAGEIDNSRTIAAKIYRNDKTEPMARAVLGIEAFSRGRSSRAEKYLKQPTADLTVNILMRLVQGWNEVDQNKLDRARKTFRGLGGATYFSTYSELQIAKLELGAGNYDAADEALKKVEEIGMSPVENVLTRARLEMARGDREAAIAALQAFAEDNDAAETGPTAAMLDTLQSGGKITTKLSPKEQAARALVDPAFAFFVANRAPDGAEIYLRMARQIDPSYDKAVIWLGALLEDTDRDAEAYALYKAMDDNSPYYVSARLNQANIHFSADEDDEALVILEDLAETHPSFITREAVGRARFFREAYAEALPFYDTLVQSMTDEELTKNIEPLRLRGIIYERIDQWSKAEADFKRVLSIDPDNVDTLNYLGYTWVDRGENLTEAFDMIRKAVEMQPRSGAIVDSLGWAHYKLGQYEEAKINLEKAASLSPSSATIIDHLGDVYWKVGRKREAGYQWERALEFEPTDEERAAIEIKLKGGLEALP
ncbi:tetratricopeptide repeat protein [Litorimonas sp. RW-G-Af-16]|uniref:tetratricopeptide repeat protein n=1 Tax=Litorimonas sp. RW-G-Af-16 TaxID=3241168 RepID=UPI00390C6CD8